MVERKEYLDQLWAWKDEQADQGRDRNPSLWKICTSGTVSAETLGEWSRTRTDYFYQL